MTVAGFADLIGKLNAINDWHLGVLINGDHYCRSIDTLVMDYVCDILGKAEAIKNRDTKAVGELMNALLLTGASISLYGSSRPISGAEHHFSHYLEVLGDQRGKALRHARRAGRRRHGSGADSGGEACIYNAGLRRGARAAARYDAAAWENEIRRAYGDAADAIIALEAQAGKTETTGRLKRIDIMQRHWEEVRAMLAGVYPAEKLRALLKGIGCPCTPRDIGVTKDVLRGCAALLQGRHARATPLYQLAWDLGLLERLADDLVRRGGLRGLK